MALERELSNNYPGPVTDLAKHVLYSPAWHEIYNLIHGFYHGSYYGDDMKPQAAGKAKRVKKDSSNIQSNFDDTDDYNELEGVV